MKLQSACLPVVHDSGQSAARWITPRLTKCLRCKTANIFAKFAPLIRQRMSAYVRWRTCSFTKAANEQNSEHIRYVRFGYPSAKFVH